MEKSQKNSLGIVRIIIIAAVAILGGGYFIFFHKACELVSPLKMGQSDTNIVEKNGKLYLCRTYFERLTLSPAPATQNQQVQQPPPPAPSAELDISTWKTYRNEQYGFEFKFPPSWQEGGSNRDGLYLDGQQEGHIEILQRGDDLNFSDRPANLTPAERERYKMNLDQFMEQAKHNDAFQNMKKTQLNGHNAYEIDFRTMVGEYGRAETYHEEIAFAVFVENEKGYVNQIMFDGRVDKNALTSQERKILSTFKFIK